MFLLPVYCICIISLLMGQGDIWNEGKNVFLASGFHYLTSVLTWLLFANMLFCNIILFTRILFTQNFSSTFEHIYFFFSVGFTFSVIKSFFYFQR